MTKSFHDKIFLGDDMEKEEKFLISRVMDLYQKYQRKNISSSTSFLDESSYLFLSNYLQKQKISFKTYQAHPLCTKKIIYFGEEDSFVTSYRFLNIEGKIKHSDVLGSLFALGLSHEVIGDIFVESDYIYFSILTKVVPIIEEYFRTVSRYSITLEKCPITLKETHEEEFTISVSSMRIDCILSRIIPCSRKSSLEFIKEGRVLLFNREISSFNLILKKGDILSIRGVGKYRIEDEVGSSKSGKRIISVIKYR